ncbi:hypothetical protein CERSUDRAFT_22896, partial [Gelatoporia subvermispora B]
TPTVLVDKHDVIFAVLAGRPINDASWDSVCDSAADAMHLAHKKASFTEKYKTNRRGDFDSLSIGVSFGGGQEVPSFLSHSDKNQRALSSLLENSNICRIARFGSAAVAFFAPKLFVYYRDVLGQLFKTCTELGWNFSNSVFPCATFNFGPCVVTRYHVDSGNLPSGWCSIWCGGNFDHMRGGHMVLADAGVAIQFPPGSTMLIPSGSLLHGNAAVDDKETRIFFTQYAAGGLFRYVEYGFR